MPWNPDHVKKDRTIRLRIDPDTDAKLTKIMESRQLSISSTIRCLIAEEYERCTGFMVYAAVMADGSAEAYTTVAEARAVSDDVRRIRAAQTSDFFADTQFANAELWYDADELAPAEPV